MEYSFLSAFCLDDIWWIPIWNLMKEIMPYGAFQSVALWDLQLFLLCSSFPLFCIAICFAELNHLLGIAEKLSFQEKAWKRKKDSWKPQVDFVSFLDCSLPSSPFFPFILNTISVMNCYSVSLWKEVNSVHLGYWIAPASSVYYLFSTGTCKQRKWEPYLLRKRDTSPTLL